MKIWKSSIIFLGLVFLTCGVVFGPQIISNQKEENILNEVIHRNYSAGNRPKLTSEQVARLYYMREVAMDYDVFSISSDNSCALQVNITDLIELQFGADETICAYLKEIFTNGNIKYSRNSNLIKIENQPTALNFLTCSVEAENGYFEIFYEEKTKTIISVSVSVLGTVFENIEEMYLFIGKIDSIIHTYFEQQLHFKSDEYYFVVDIPEISEKGEIDCSADIFISGGLMQHDDKMMHEAERHYN